jgi:hypothetical protein
MTDPWWRRWFLPERPGLRQFALAAAALLAPAPALLAGPDWMLPTMVIAVAIGGGLGIGWALTVGREWFANAPASAAGVLAIAFACLAHLELMPYWNLVLRTRALREDLGWWLAHHAERHLDEPTYDCGPWRATLDVREGAGGIYAYTPEPLLRWSPFGWRGQWFVLLRPHGEEIAIETFFTADALQQALPPASTAASVR